MTPSESLARTLSLVDEVMKSSEVAPLDELRRYNGKIPQGMRPGFVIVKAIETSGLTLTEMHNILEAISKRVSSCIREYPELEETSCDLELTCKSFIEAQDSIDERLYRNDHDARAE